MEKKEVIEIKITMSRGYGKNGKISAFVRPDYYCFNKSRKVSAGTQEELQEAIDKVVDKWYKPELFVYEINSHTIVSNNEDNALTEYWRACNRNDIGKMFTVQIQK